MCITKNVCTDFVYNILGKYKVTQTLQIYTTCTILLLTSRAIRDHLPGRVPGILGSVTYSL